MQEHELISRLHQEGFKRAYAWEDVPNARYPDHTHLTETAHVVLSGQLTLTMNAKSTTYGAGQRCDVPANAVHSAIIGPEGCRYLIGER